MVKAVKIRFYERFEPELNTGSRGLEWKGRRGVGVYGVPSVKNIEERDRFWNNMDKTLDSVGNVYRLCILENLNG